jgi:hypothetical protein
MSNERVLTKRLSQQHPLLNHQQQGPPLQQQLAPRRMRPQPLLQRSTTAQPVH